MAFFDWNNSYSVGVRQFDTEHQKLFSIMSELYDGMKAGKGKDVLDGVLQKLIGYTEQHFSSEETVMGRAGYPGLQSQIDQHRQFTVKMKDFQAQYRSGAVALSVQLLDYLRDWLTTHIAGADKSYTAFLNAKGVH
jgi:hemerythrin-like metal-binding protein